MVDCPAGSEDCHMLEVDRTPYHAAYPVLQQVFIQVAGRSLIKLLVIRRCKCTEHHLQVHGRSIFNALLRKLTRATRCL